jgi:hypothetical protein
MKAHKIILNGFEIIESVGHCYGGSSARVYVPKHWENKKIAIVRLQ